MPESEDTVGIFTFSPHHDVSEHSSKTYSAIKLASMGYVLIPVEELIVDNNNAPSDLGPVSLHNSVEVVSLINHTDGVFTEGSV